MPGRDDGLRTLTRGLLWNGTLASVMVVDPATHVILDINDKALQMIGRPRDQVVGSVCHRFVCPSEAGKCPITDRGRTVDQSERGVIAANGELVPILKSVNEVVVRGRPLLVESFVNVTALKQTQHALEESRRFIQSVVDGIGDPVLVIDPADHRIVLANRTVIEQCGRDPVKLGESCYQASHGLDHPCDGEHGECPMQVAFATGRPARATHRHVTAGGETTVDILASPVISPEGRVIHVVEACRDITQHKQAEEERVRLTRLLHQAQKMESIGTLVSGIAHDFNNILLATIGFADAAAEKLPAGHPALAELEVVVSAGERGADLIRQLLAFGRQQDLRMRPVDLNALVRETGRLLDHVLPRRVATEVWLGDGVPPVLADPIQIEQVLMNLAVNARDAMPEGGTLTISTEPVGLLEAAMTEPLGLAPGLYALLRVRDTGVGIPKEHRERIFDPFFTTKEEGKGTGLGLSTVYGIVAQHGGTIRVDSRPGVGTVFTVWIPAFEGPACPSLPEDAAPLPRGSETVAVVEDEAPMRRIIARTLENLGYTVLEAESAEECLSLFAARGGEVRVLLCDMILPGASGAELVSRLREREPGLRVLFMSGHPRNYLAQRGMIAESDPLIGKAKGPGAIARALRALLDGQPAG